MQMSLPKKAPRKFMQVKEKRNTTTNAPFAQKHARDSCRRHHRRRRRPRPRSWKQMLQVMLCYTDRVLQAFSRKRNAEAVERRSQPKGERGVCDAEAGFWVTPALEGGLPQSGASRSFAADARAGFTLPLCNPWLFLAVR